MIAVEWSRQARETLTAAGADVLYREAPLPHTIDPAFRSSGPGYVGLWTWMPADLR